MKLHVYWELATLLNICRSVSVRVCVNVCVLHLAVTVTLYNHSVSSGTSICTYNLYVAFNEFK